jgi:YfiR/HmsC-like
MISKRILLIFFLSITSGALFAQEQEENLKAAFIYNFTKYIEWQVSNGSNQFVIGVIGSSPVTNALKQIAASNRVNGKPVIVREFDSPDDISNCNILFIPRNCGYDLSSILPKVAGETLTVSEQPGFAKKGTAFNFVIINNKLKFEANLKALSMARLKAGSQLLKLAIIVD